MQERSADQCNHEFRCMRAKGTFSEVTTSEPLTTVQLDLVKKDPTQAEKVCPHGAILCAKCQTPLIPGQALPSVPDTRTISAKLRRPQ